MPRCHVQLNSVEPLGAVNVTVFTSPWCMAPVLTCRPSMVKLWLLPPALRTSTVTAEPARTSRTCGWNVLSCMRIRTAPGPAAPARTLPAAFSPCWQPASRTTSPMATPTVNSILQRPIWIPPDPTLPSCGDRGGCGSLPCPSMPDLCCAFMSSPSLFQALRGRLGCSCRCGWLPVVVAGVAGLPDPPVDHPQRRRQPPKDGLDLPWGGLIQHPGQELRGAADADAAALVVAERLPLGRGEGLVDQRQHVALLVGQVPVQPGGQGVDGVPEALVAAVAVGEGAVDRLEQRVDAGVLVLHGLQQSQLVGTVGQVAGRLAGHRHAPFVCPCAAPVRPRWQRAGSLTSAGWTIRPGGWPNGPAGPCRRTVAGGQPPASLRCWTTHPAIWTREANPSLVRMCATWWAMVGRLRYSRRAIAGLDRPSVTSAATSSSRGDSSLIVAYRLIRSPRRGRCGLGFAGTLAAATGSGRHPEGQFRVESCEPGGPGWEPKGVAG